MSVSKIILGQPFMRTVIGIFDMDKLTIGLAGNFTDLTPSVSNQYNPFPVSGNPNNNTDGDGDDDDDSDGDDGFSLPKVPTRFEIYRYGALLFFILGFPGVTLASIFYLNKRLKDYEHNENKRLKEEHEKRSYHAESTQELVRALMA